MDEQGNATKKVTKRIVYINSIVTKGTEGAVQGVLRNSSSINSFKSPMKTPTTVS